MDATLVVLWFSLVLMLSVYTWGYFRPAYVRCSDVPVPVGPGRHSKSCKHLIKESFSVILIVFPTTLMSAPSIMHNFHSSQGPLHPDSTPWGATWKMETHLRRLFWSSLWWVNTLMTVWTGPQPIRLLYTLTAVSYTHLTLPTKRIV